MNYNLPVVFGKITEQMHLEAIFRYMKNRKAIGNTSMYLPPKGRLCGTNQTVLYDEITYALAEA